MRAKDNRIYYKLKFLKTLKICNLIIRCLYLSKSYNNPLYRQNTKKI